MNVCQSTAWALFLACCYILCQHRAHSHNELHIIPSSPADRVTLLAHITWPQGSACLCTGPPFASADALRGASQKDCLALEG